MADRRASGRRGPGPAILVAGLLACGLTVPAMAQGASPAAPAASASSPGEPATPLSGLYACAAVQGAAERLACYDAAVAQLRGREQRAEVVAVDRAAVEQVRREAFGFRVPSLPALFGRRAAAAGAAPVAAAGAAGAAAATQPGASGASPSGPAAAIDDEDERQTMTVTRLSVRAERTHMDMSNGQVWRFVDTGEITPPRRTPFEVTIRRAALGSFILSVEGSNRGYRVRRVD